MAPDSTPVLPQYPELILAALEAIGSKKGANKSKISRKIQLTYGTLPAAHATLLSHHLNRMKATGQLNFVQNNYVIPDPDAPPKRGRGRPAKPKKPVPEGAVKSPPRPRGRPANPGSKPKAATPTVSGEKRGRGRPPKPGKKVAAPVLLPSGERRGRGRPPKVNTPVSAAPVGA
ncbi:winged helix-turn-helix DNA-binding domain, AT hook-like protein [Artemisia annua]|uniref:Winged helix-turn-helix DNA-binding domain, AT hook-like protein n=1 Tax=Artemisia annua TaxID=35608 RepID=A0A2U1M7Z1_ARTAN|nr:winged helix-turn-helix DNA-binding domain, AT hook-like protein [Artemisia annua]